MTSCEIGPSCQYPYKPCSARKFISSQLFLREKSGFCVYKSVSWPATEFMRAGHQRDKLRCYLISGLICSVDIIIVLERTIWITHPSVMILDLNHTELISLTYLFYGLRFIKVSISYAFNVMFTAMVWAIWPGLACILKAGWSVWMRWLLWPRARFKEKRRKLSFIWRQASPIKWRARLKKRRPGPNQVAWNFPYL